MILDELPTWIRHFDSKITKIWCVVRSYVACNVVKEPIRFMSNCETRKPTQCYVANVNLHYEYVWSQIPKCQSVRKWNLTFIRWILASALGTSTRRKTVSIFIESNMIFCESIIILIFFTNSGENSRSNQKRPSRRRSWETETRMPEASELCSFGEASKSRYFFEEIIT